MLVTKPQRQNRKGLLKPLHLCSFVYVDTFKVLTKVHGFEVILYGHGSSFEIDDLESQLSAGRRIEALITEFPGNPLLKSPDLKRLHALSQTYQFVLIVDDTIGTFVNVALLPFCDLICTSLTKMFSGACNVMGGSVILNPSSPHHLTMHNVLSLQFIDTFFPPEAAIMELNSQDYEPRVLRASSTAEVICELLNQHPAVSQVFYPKGSPCQPIYDGLRRPHGKYGFLLSATFVSPEGAIAFYDALDVAKGPSLGTNFTLACAYTLLAHYGEREWAARYGVVEHLVRISVGLEERGGLVERLQRALAAAAAAEVRVGDLGGVETGERS
jgi:cystathionine gamma-synthase